MKYKVCSICKIERPLDSFYKRKRSKDGLHTYCKDCTSIRNKQWADNNKDWYKKRNAEWYVKNKEKANRNSTEWHYQTHYGISYSDFLLLANNQENKCIICKVPLSFGKPDTTRAVLDHCHTTGKIRGVLCSQCNTALGGFKDDPVLVTNALFYLENSNKATST